jgi:hypothetical protein
MLLEKAAFVDNLYHPNAQRGLDAFIEKTQAQYPTS